MRVSELRSLTVNEIDQKLNDLKKELFNLRFQAATGEIQNYRRIRTVKKDIARGLTVRAEKKKEEK